MITTHRLLATAALLAAGIGGSAWLLTSQPAANKPQTLGPTADGGYLIPNGWKIKPVGTQLQLDTFPMASVITRDGKYMVVLNGGYKPPSLSVVDTSTMKETSRTPVSDGWLGLAMTRDEKFLYVGGGARASVFEFAFDAATGKVTPARTFEAVAQADRKPEDFIGDVQISPDGRLIYAADLYRDRVIVINPQSGRVIEQFPTGRRPYRILFHPDGKSYFVTSWADGTLYHHRATDGERLGFLRLGPHTTDMLLSAKAVKAEEGEEGEKKPDWKQRIFITAGNTNHVYVVGLSEAKDMRLIETINLAMTPRQPAGMTPSALALSPDEETLHVVCSDANAVAVVEVEEAKSQVKGFVPTGWYPTAARVLKDNRLLVFNGRGLRSFPNPGGPKPVTGDSPVHQGVKSDEYVGRIQIGSISIIDPLDKEKLAEYTKLTYANSPYRDELLDGVKDIPAGNPIPARPGVKGPIQHVVYILKENRTYDQVLGDIGIGNSDPSLCLFGEKYSPNHHKLAREFVLLDNFYVNADVSADGHNWSTAAIAPDYVQRMWPNSYGGRRKKYDYEGGEPAALPPAGYLWTNAASAGISMRNYGFWVETRKERAADGTWVARVKDPTLAKVTNMKYPGFNLDIQDIERARIFLEELAEFERAGSMPSLTLLRIGNDHTSGTSPGKYAPLAAVADNDAALGMIIEGLSKSKFWGKMAVFVVEDDAQNGADHVDSHRSPAFVLSPYTRRGVVDSTFYNQTSILRTMELILGLKPMTQFDAAARPMWPAFASTADAKPYVPEKPRIDLNERNPQKTATSARSMRMDFSREDAIDDDELNEILWVAIRGGQSPAPVRSYFAK